MKLPQFGFQRWMQVASVFILLGLIVEIISLFWFHPLSFVLFALFGTALIAVGILVYLASLIFAAN